MNSKTNAVVLFRTLLNEVTHPYIQLSEKEREAIAQRQCLVLVKEILSLRSIGEVMREDGSSEKEFWKEVRAHIESIEPSSGVKHLL